MRYEVCREAKDKFYEDKCKDIEMLDKAHSQLMYQKIKELRPKGNRGLQTSRGKQGNVLMEKDEVMERWAEYVKELCRDETRGEDASIDRIIGVKWRVRCTQSVAKRLKL